MESFLLRFGDAEPHLLEQIKGNSIKNSKKKEALWKYLSFEAFGMMCELKTPQNLMHFVERI